MASVVVLIDGAAFRPTCCVAEVSPLCAPVMVGNPKDEVL